MNIFKFTIALRALGFSFSVIGKLLKTISQTLSDPNLGSDSIANRDQLSQSQESPITKVKEDEKPESSRQQDLFADSDSPTQNVSEVGKPGQPQ